MYIDTKLHIKNYIWNKSIKWTRCMIYGMWALTEPGPSGPSSLMRSCPASAPYLTRCPHLGGWPRSQSHLNVPPGMETSAIAPSNSSSSMSESCREFSSLLSLMFWPPRWSSPASEPCTIGVSLGGMGAAWVWGHTSFHILFCSLVFYYNIRVPLVVLFLLNPPDRTRTPKTGHPPLHPWRRSVGTQTHQI